MSLSVRDVEAVSAAIVDVVEQEVLPQLGKPGNEDAREKTEISAVDALATKLTGLSPDSVVISRLSNPRALDAIQHKEPVWLINPVDGTARRFAAHVALRANGETLAAWLYAPVAGLTATARPGAGTYVNGSRARVREAREPAVAVRDFAEGAERLKHASVRTAPCTSIGLEYLDLSTGRRTAAVFGGEHPWDHAAGLLIHAEAGGVHATADGGPFYVEGDNFLPLVAAVSAETVERLHTIVAG